MRRAVLAGLAAFAALTALAAAVLARHDPAPVPAWTPEELRLMTGAWIGSLPPPPPDPSNAHADDPAAARLGKALFFDPSLSGNGTVSCASCHRPDRKLADDLASSRGMGETTRNAPSIAGAAWSPWLFWDGRRDSLWAQALAPLESADEHGISRGALAHAIARGHRHEYEAVFGRLPGLNDRSRFPEAAGPLGSPEERAAWDAMRPEDRLAVDVVFTNAGKAIAAYERRLRLAPSRFDRHVEALVRAGEATSLDASEQAGLRLFLGRAGCVQCHSGPLFTNHEFHGIGLPPRPGSGVDPGRREGVVALVTDPFNCLGELSDASPEACEELRFVKTSGDELLGAMRVPSLRNVADTAPYMHDGSLADLPSVLRHYDRAPEPVAGHSDLLPLDLDPAELRDLEAFLRTLSSEIVDDVEPPAAPSMEAHAMDAGLPASLGLAVPR